MPSIFGNTDDISFGSGPSKQEPEPKKQNFFEKKPAPIPLPSAGTFVHIPHDKKKEMITPNPSVDEMPALSRLIVSMKPTYFPTGGEDRLRLVALSSSSMKDPAFLIRAEETTILYGTGFGDEKINGVSYPTFPDMRIVVSEKDRLSAWILAEDSIDVSLFGHILPTLGFPPVYASRMLISRIRTDMESHPALLEKCRFFEIFTPDTSLRKMGNIEIATTLVSAGSYLSFRYMDTILYDDRKEFPSALPKTSQNPHIISLHAGDTGFILTNGGEMTFLPGEIVSLAPKKIEKHTLRFTFDTFYMDKQSIGVVAGYTLKDRKELGEHGVLTFVLEEDRQKRAIIAHIYIDSRGFVHSHEMMAVHKEILKGIRATYEKAVSDNPGIERAELVQIMRREITKYCYLFTGRTPVVMPIILER